jgi:hypothetical protein
MRKKLIILINFIKLFSMDKNEKKFLLKSPFLKNSTKSEKSIVLVQMPMDYFYVSCFSILTDELTKSSQAKLVGLWPYNIRMLPLFNQKSVFKKFLHTFYDWLHNSLSYIKWSHLYQGVGLLDYIKLGNVSFINNIKNAKKAAKIFKSLETKQQLIDLVINDVYCGDLIYDTYIRFRAVHTVDINDTYLRYLIHQCINGQQSMRAYFENVKVEVLLSSYASYIQHGLPVREALRLGVKVYTSGTLAQYTKKLSPKNFLHTPDYQNYSDSFSLLPNQNEKLKMAKVEIESRFEGKIDKATKYMKKSAYSSEDSELEDGIEGVVFLHDFYDSPHCFGTILFEDYWEWACFTLQTIQDYNLKIAVKPHPNQIPEGLITIKLLKEKYPNISWIDASVSNKKIFKSGILCGISVHGTVLHELAYHEIAAIAAGDHPHMSFNIARTPKTKNEYKKFLINYKSLKTPKNVKQQVLAYYYMNNLHNKEALSSRLVDIRLRSIDTSKSECLIQFLELLETNGKAL